jgi:hypothetical protein
MHRAHKDTVTVIKTARPPEAVAGQDRPQPSEKPPGKRLTGANLEATALLPCPSIDLSHLLSYA